MEHQITANRPNEADVPCKDAVVGTKYREM